MKNDFNFDYIDSNSFIDLLGLRGKRFHKSASLDALIGTAFDFADTIWKSPQLYKFVDHGIDHSFHVLLKAKDIFDKLRPDNSNLSSYESTILGISALIHDIGMQYEKYPKPGEEYTQHQIRKKHIQLGHEMILDTINKNLPDNRGGPGIGLPDHHLSFLYDSALVAFAHSGRLFWDKLGETQYDRFKSAGYYRRLRLLAALIRIGDELHTEHTRIPELNFIKSPLLDDEGLAHWCVCHYVQDIKIVSPGPGSARVKMYWRVPEDVDDVEVQKIRTLLQDLRERKINNEFNMIQPYLVLDENTEPCMLEFNLESEPEKNPAVSKLPPEISDYIMAKLRPYQFGAKETKHTDAINQLQLQPEHEHIRKKAESFVIKSHGVKSGHFRLKTGWHTDRMVNCRELCSDIIFINDLCAILSKHYTEFNITDILAIGTSAIGIASNLALMLNANILFTF